MKAQINIAKFPALLDIAKWAVDGIECLPIDEREELHGQYFENPAAIQSGFFVIESRGVAEDILFRIESQLVQMSEDESANKSRNVRRNVLRLANMIRNAYGMKEITNDDLG